MEFFEKISDTITTKGKEAADKAKDLTEIVKLKSKIASSEEIIKKNYLEIGKLYYEEYKDVQDAPFEKQRQAICEAQNDITDLQNQIQEIKGI